MKVCFILVLLIICLSRASVRADVVVTKCCAPSDRINSISNNCGSNKGGIPFSITVKNNTGYTQKNEKCSKIKKQYKGAKYEVSEKEITIFSQGAVEFYQDYCVDIDLEPGHETVILICDNFVNITKCCALGEVLAESKDKLTCNNGSTNPLDLPGKQNINIFISNQTEFLANQSLDLGQSYRITNKVGVFEKYNRLM
jgi:hypothetical protein